MNSYIHSEYFTMGRLIKDIKYLVVLFLLYV